MVDIRKIWRSGSDSYSHCISIPIKLARKYRMNIGDLILFTDTNNGLLIKKVSIVEDEK